MERISHLERIVLEVGAQLRGVCESPEAVEGHHDHREQFEQVRRGPGPVQDGRSQDEERVQE